jgi:hypothetical protein
MRSSCISHPNSEPLIIIRKWQIEFCEGNQCAAALLSFLEYWHNIRLEQSQKAEQENTIQKLHGDPPTQNESLIQFHTAEDLEAGILIFKRKAIADAIDLLEKKGVIFVMRNPNPRYKFDRTRHFLFKPKVIMEWLKVTGRLSQNGLSSAQKGSRSDKKGQAIPETTTEIKDPPALFDLESNQIKLPPKPPWPEGFEDFWFAYPAHRRGDKKKTAKIFLTEIKTSDYRTRLMQGLELWKKCEQWENDRIERADRFLERHQWEITPRIGKRQSTAEEDREHERIMLEIEQEAQRRAAQRIQQRNAAT